jgi:hypothetical protein
LCVHLPRRLVGQVKLVRKHGFLLVCHCRKDVQPCPALGERATGVTEERNLSAAFTRCSLRNERAGFASVFERVALGVGRGFEVRPNAQTSDRGGKPHGCMPRFELLVGLVGH